MPYTAEKSGGNEVEKWIIEFMNEFGYIGVLLLIMLENIFPPIPSEIILTFGGFMTTYSEMTKFWLIIAATVGSVAGAMILYTIGLLVGVSRLEKIIDRWGKYLRLTRNDIYRAEAWFNKYGPWTVFFFRLVPLIRSLISIPAGMSGMNFPLFILLTTLGSLLWNSILISVGVEVGANWQEVVAYMDVFSNIVYIIIGISVVLVIIWFVRRYKRRV